MIYMIHIFVIEDAFENFHQHYFLYFWWADANGHGWWDDDMEGVDNEALGVSEVWEGVGSTTLGGIVDWHWCYCCLLLLRPGSRKSKSDIVYACMWQMWLILALRSIQL
jgi:hypothetical protein